MLWTHELRTEFDRPGKMSGSDILAEVIFNLSEDEFRWGC